MFNQKNKIIKNLEKEKSEQIEDFILILNTIQNIIEQPMQWKQKTLTLRNQVAFAIEHYESKKN